MTKIDDITGDDLKSQQDEYYLLVAEIIDGLSADLTEHVNLHLNLTCLLQ